MFVQAIRIAMQAMFPIFRYDGVGTDVLQISVHGTGYFINSRGYFVSVAHLFDNPTPRTRFVYSGELPEDLVEPPLTITEVARDDERDIFVGKIDIEPGNYFDLFKDVPSVGESVCLAGYPLASVVIDEHKRVDLRAVRRYFLPSLVLDMAHLPTDTGSGIRRSHEGFLLTDVGLFGMSGGPIFDVNGTVLGMQASVTMPRISKGPCGREIVVENAVGIWTPAIIHLLQRHGIAFNQPRFRRRGQTPMDSGAA